MIYYVTTHLHVDPVSGSMSADVAEATIKNDEVATVSSFKVAEKVLMRFGLSEEEAEDRCRFAETGNL